jgi:exodeoxyribonuclease VII small subunit
MSKKSQASISSMFENLESVAKKLEREDLPLDEALKTFQEGVELTKQVQVALNESEQRVQRLLSSEIDSKEYPSACKEKE